MIELEKILEELEQGLSASGLRRCSEEAFIIERESVKGEGGFSTVYTARNQSDGTLVAAKTIPIEGLRKNGVYRKRLLARVDLREEPDLQGAKHLLFPHSYLLNKNECVLFMELFDCDLREYASRVRKKRGDSPATNKMILEAMISATEGLGELAAVGRLHRDFKPTNILIRYDEETRPVDVVLSDLDLAGMDVHHGGARTMTCDFMDGGGMMGTPFYIRREAIMDPERFKRGDPRDFDIYAAGITLAEMFCDLEIPAVGNIETMIGARETFLRREDLRKKTKERGVDGVEMIVTRAMDPRLKRTYSSVDQMKNDLKRVKEGKGGKLRYALAHHRSWSYRGGATKARWRSATALLGMALVGLATYQWIAYERSPLPIFRNIQEQKSLNTGENDALFRAIAEDYKREINHLSLDKKLPFPMGSMQSNKTFYPTSEISIMSGEFLRDLYALWQGSGDEYFATEYIRFGQLLSLDLDANANGRATDLNMPILGRFRGLTSIGTLARRKPDLFKDLDGSERRRLLEAPPFAANIVLHAWEDPNYGILDSYTGRRSNHVVLDAQNVYWLLPFIAEIPFSYPANQFLVKGKNFQAWRKTDAKKVWDGGKLSVTDYLRLLTTNAEKSIDYLTVEGTGYSFAEVYREKGEEHVKRLSRQKNRATMYDHTGLLLGLADTIHTVESILSAEGKNKPLETYRTLLEKEQGMRGSRFETEMHLRDERMLVQAMKLIDTYERALPPQSWIPRELMGADGKGEGREDIASAQRAMVSATLLLDIADALKMDQKERTRLEHIREQTLMMLLNEKQYMCRPGLMRNLLPFGLFGYGRFISDNAYGSFNGTIADIYYSSKETKR